MEREKVKWERERDRDGGPGRDGERVSEIWVKEKKLGERGNRV